MTALSLFFESLDALSTADENHKRDVYEFERAGAGTLHELTSPSFDPVSDGCHFLLSSGKSTDESYLLDASGSGRDVFFSTRRSLVGWDQNENYDVYDAREGGGFPEPSEQAFCLGETCRSSSSLASSPFSPTIAMSRERGESRAAGREGHSQADGEAADAGAEAREGVEGL